MNSSDGAALELAYFLVTIAGLLALWNLISPKSVWWTLWSWGYQDPAAHEPSDAWYFKQRVAAVVVLMSVVATAVGLSHVAAEMDPQQERQYQECLNENDEEGLSSAEDWCEDLSPAPEQPS